MPAGAGGQAEALCPSPALWPLARMLRMQAPPRTWQGTVGRARTPGKDGRWIANSCPGLPSPLPFTPAWLLATVLSAHSSLLAWKETSGISLIPKLHLKMSLAALCLGYFERLHSLGPELPSRKLSLPHPTPGHWNRKPFRTQDW